MGTKLTSEEISEQIAKNPNEGFDQCDYCNGHEVQNTMIGFDNSDTLICVECNQVKFDAIENELIKAIDGAFVVAHQEFNTKSGDITMEQVERLDSLRDEVFDLILDQVRENI